MLYIVWLLLVRILVLVYIAPDLKNEEKNNVYKQGGENWKSFDVHGRKKVQRASIYTGYYYDTYGIGTPW